MKNKETKQEKLIVLMSTIALVLIVTGTTFAYYYANFIGTRENSLISGKIEITYDNESAMTLTSAPVEDSVGAAISDSDAYTFDVNATINGDAQINYDLAFELISNEGITSDNVKINLLKKYVLNGTSKQEYVIGSATTGEVVSSLQARTSSNNYFNEFVIDNGSFTSTGTVSYVLKAWVSSDNIGDLVLDTTDTSNVCSDTTYTTQTTCEAAGAVWGSSHNIATATDLNYQFKVKLKGGQVEN